MYPPSSVYARMKEVGHVNIIHLALNTNYQSGLYINTTAANEMISILYNYRKIFINVAPYSRCDLLLIARSSLCFIKFITQL